MLPLMCLSDVPEHSGGRAACHPNVHSGTLGTLENPQVRSKLARPSTNLSPVMLFLPLKAALS